MFGTVSKRDVLTLIGERSGERKVTSYRTLTSSFFLSAEAACSHLKRLWQERLIKSTGDPACFNQAVESHPSIRELDFRITRRGVERLEHWEALEEEGEWLS